MRRKKEKLVELISAEQKLPFDMRREKEKLVEFTKVYGNIAVSLTSIVGYPLQEKDSLSFHSSCKVDIVRKDSHNTSLIASVRPRGLVFFLYLKYT